MANDIQQGRFNTLTIQTVVGLGPEAHTEMLRRALQSLHFVNFKAAKTVRDVDTSAQFVVVVADYANSPAVQQLAQSMQALSEHPGTKLMYVINPAQLSNEELLFGVELDVKRTFFSLRKDEDIRAYIKQRALETTEVGSMAHVETEVRKAVQKHDSTAISHWIEKLAQMDKTSEDVNRLLAVLTEERRDYKRYVFHLKQTLTANPQNLWAANRLGMYYLQNRQVAEGIAVLKKMSRFHELNSERMLVLGDAYLNVGKTGEAERALQKGQDLTGGQDPRFSESLAKVDLIKGDASRALERVGRKYFSNAVISFLNTRAVLAVKNSNFEEGVKLYKQALAGCDPSDAVVLAKVFFNQGLAFVRNHEPKLAEAAFQKSLEFGGNEFNRAAKPLTIAKQLVVKKHKNTANTQPMGSVQKEMEALEDFEFESVGQRAKSA